MTGDIVTLAQHYGRYGYKRITVLLRAQGWVVNHNCVERIWQQEGLKVSAYASGRAGLAMSEIMTLWPKALRTARKTARLR